MQVIPAIDVLGGEVVRLHQGDYGAATVYHPDPAAVAERWVGQGATRLHVVDLDGARLGRSDPGLWRSMRAFPTQIGGGIRDRATAVAAVDAGVDRVVVGTAAVWQPDVLHEIVQAIGGDRVVAAIDVRSGRATGAGWLDGGRALDQVVTAIVGAGVETALVTGIDRDGTMEGPDSGLLRWVAQLAPHLQLLASGGVGSLDDIRALAAEGWHGVIVGRALYERRFSLDDALRAAA